MKKEKAETEQHILQVGKLIALFCLQLLKRINTHDSSKFSKEESAGMVEVTAENRESLQSVYDYHRKHNRHHIEYHGGVSNMTLIDIIEMLCDWIDSSDDIELSIETNQKTYGYSDELKHILINTAKVLNSR